MSVSDIKISELTVASTSTNSDVLPVVQNNETKQMTKSTLLADVNTSITNIKNGTNINDFAGVESALDVVEQEQTTQDTNINSNTTAINGIRNGSTINSFAGVESALNTKVDKVAGKGLSTNDFDNTQKAQIQTNTDNILLRSLITETGNKIGLEINNTTYVLTAKLYDKNNNLISTSTGIDLPLETMVVGASYDSATKEIVLTLKNGSTVRFSVADLVSGLQSEITSSNKLASDLVDDTNQTNKFVTASEKSQITTNATAITGIKDGTTIDSFADVETALGDIDTEQTAQDTAIGNNTTAIANTNTALQNDYNDLLNVISQIVPTETDEDSEMTFANTLDARFKSIVEKGNTLQNSYTGKNILALPNGTVTNGGATVVNYYDEMNINASVTNSANLDFVLDTDLVLNGTYNLLVEFEGTKNNIDGYQVLFRKSDNSNIWASSLKNTDKDNSIKSDADATLHYVRIFLAPTTGNTLTLNGKLKIMITQSSTLDDTFEPYCGGTASPNPDYPQDVRVVTGENSVDIYNKNFIDYSKFTVTEQGTSINSYDDNNIVATFTSAYHIVPFQYNLSNTKYIFSIDSISNGTARIELDLFKNGAKVGNTHIVNPASSVYTYTINNTNNDYDTVRISLSNGNLSGTNTITYGKLQLELGETQTSYVTGKSQTYPLSLDDIELCKIGDYQDYITGTVDNWKVVKKVGKVIYTGANSEEWLLNNVYEYVTQFTGPQDTTVINETEYTKQSFTNYFTFRYGNPDDTININYYWKFQRRIVLVVKNTLASTVAELKTWLSSHNLIFYYRLNTPTETPITDSTLIEQLNAIYNARSYANETNITATCEDGNAPMIISATVLKQLT